MLTCTNRTCPFQYKYCSPVVDQNSTIDIRVQEVLILCLQEGIVSLFEELSGEQTTCTVNPSNIPTLANSNDEGVITRR